MKTLLIPVDFSAVSERQISTALLLAGSETRRIHFLHVEPPISTPGRSLRIRYRGHHSTLSSVEQAGLVESMVNETLLRCPRNDLEVTSAMRQGIPRECIMQEKEAVKANLIILGSHGHHALYHFLAGSTSLGILEDADVPLVILPQEAESGIPPTALTSILVACDFSDCTRSLITVADTLALQHGCAVHLLHVAPDPNTTGTLPPDAELMGLTPEENWDDLAQHLNLLKESMSCAPEQVHLHVEAGPRASVVLEHQARTGAELICMGTHGHSALYDLLVGSITEGVMEHADVPVLAVPKG